VIIFDDHLARAVLIGHRQVVPEDGPAATTWGFHYRLIRALTDTSIPGSLSRSTPLRMLQVASAPLQHGLHIVDPRELTTTAASLAIEHRLNLLTAELLAAAQVHDAEVVLTERNVGKRWPGLFDELGLTLTIV
jgi:hypothetical protein